MRSNVSKFHLFSLNERNTGYRKEKRKQEESSSKGTSFIHDSSFSEWERSEKKMLEKGWKKKVKQQRKTFPIKMCIFSGEEEYFFNFCHVFSLFEKDTDKEEMRGCIYTLVLLLNPRTYILKLTKDIIESEQIKTKQKCPVLVINYPDCLYSYKILYCVSFLVLVFFASLSAFENF